MICVWRSEGQLLSGRKYRLEEHNSMGHLSSAIQFVGETTPILDIMRTNGLHTDSLGGYAEVYD